jgi:acetyl esterase/lipase
MLVWRLFIALLISTCLMAGQAKAQQAPMTPRPAPAEPDAIVLNTGGVRDATGPESWFEQYGDPFVRNVTVATLTPVLPDPDKATGAAVIVAPGGGFLFLSMGNEGWEVARALADRGVAAFVLKYRTRLVRARAAEWRVDPDRIGMVGFSAGAMTTLATTLSSPEADPAFIASIYGPLTAVEVPADAPPMFVALAADDPLFAHSGFGLVEAWRAAGRPVEFHLYQNGGHGFGLGNPGKTSNGWFEVFMRWVEMNGF